MDVTAHQPRRIAGSATSLFAASVARACRSSSSVCAKCGANQHGSDGDLTQKITVDVRGEILQIKNVINKMVDQLNSFAAEVTRVAKEVGTDGRLGGQAEVPGVSATWKDLADNVNFMAANLTKQVRGIIKVVTAIASGDLSQKFVLEAKGEVAALGETINNMADAFRIFADQITTIAREVGIEGKLGGEAKAPSAAGTWRDLTDNVNQLAGNLTSQVRAIAEVSTAVAKAISPATSMSKHKERWPHLKTTSIR